MKWKAKNKAIGSAEPLLDTFRSFLIQSGYKPGDRIETEQQLADRFGVSRSRMREVTTTLCQLGILESRPRRGTLLKSFDPIPMGEHLGFHFAMAGLNPADSREARQIIELAILPLVVRRVTPSLQSEMEATIRRMEEKSNTPRDIYRADRDFHLLFLKACGNETLQAFAQVIMSIFDQQYPHYPVKPEIVRSSIEEHRKLLEAIEAGDVDSALHVLRQHLTRKARQQEDT